MYWWFNNRQNTTQEMSSDTESDYETEYDYDYEIEGTTIYEKQYKDYLFEKKMVSARDFLKNIPNWTYNRNLSIEHIQKLYEDFEQMKENIQVIGSFKVVSYRDDNEDKDVSAIIDGQHRQKALLRILEENIHLDFDLEVDIFYLSDKKQIKELFERGNNIKNISPDDIPKMETTYLLEQIVNNPELSNGIKTDQKKETAQYPCIHKKQLYRLLKQQDLSNCNIETILETIIKLNRRLSVTRHTELFRKGIRKITDTRRKRLDKAQNTGFYLNLDKDAKYTPEKWIPMIFESKIYIDSEGQLIIDEEQE